MGTASIGPAAWRNNTVKEIKLSQNVIQRSDKGCELGRSLDPLPHLRDVVAELSNEEAHRYFRQTRSVVCLLRESLIDTNEEIKSLTRGKEALEKALEHIRKDIKLNQECLEIRQSRPQREKDNDGADDLLQAERMHLLNLKRMLEAQLKLVQQQLQVLDAARRRLSACLQERSRVMDLVCAALPGAAVSQSAYFATRGGPLGPRSLRPSMSADRDRSELGSNPTIDPLGPYTPEADQALQEAKEARTRSALLRQDAATSIDRCNKTQKQAHRSVNDGLTSKVSETAELKQHLDVAFGENRHAVHRAQRWYDSTEKAWGYSKGPVASSDLTCREKINRPVVRVFQRHPGNNLPEAQEIIKGGGGLLESLQTTSRNLGLMNLAQLKLKDNIRDKKAAVDVDSSIVRMRRRKANHRWAMGQAF